MINERNIPGATITLVGWAAGDAENPLYDRDGSRGIKQLRIPVREGYTKDGEFIERGTTWYTVTGKDENIGHVRKGDKIRLDDAKLEAREFTRKDGSQGQAFETSYGRLTILESKNGNDSGQDGAYEDEEPF